MMRSHMNVKFITVWMFHIQKCISSNRLAVGRGLCSHSLVFQRKFPQRAFVPNTLWSLTLMPAMDKGKLNALTAK
jgi:hypothetical protein